MDVKDYSLSQIAQIVESNNARILYSYILTIPETSNVEIIIKLNTVDLTSILETFSRYSYNVVHYFNATDDAQRLIDERYDLLMKYLNI